MFMSLESQQKIVLTEFRFIYVNHENACVIDLQNLQSVFGYICKLLPYSVYQIFKWLTMAPRSFLKNFVSKEKRINAKRCSSSG